MTERAADLVDGFRAGRVVRLLHKFLNCGQPPALAILHSQDIALKLSLAAEDRGAWSQTVKTLGAGWMDTFIYFMLLPIRNG